MLLDIFFDLIEEFRTSLQGQLRLVANLPVRNGNMESLYHPQRV